MGHHPRQPGSVTTVVETVAHHPTRATLTITEAVAVEASEVEVVTVTTGTTIVITIEGGPEVVTIGHRGCKTAVAEIVAVAAVGNGKPIFVFTL